MRSAIQANRGQASLLQGLPAETPETPVLISKIYQFFSFSFQVHLFCDPVLFEMCSFLPIHPYTAGIWHTAMEKLCKTRVISDLAQIASVRVRYYA
jgi:hypothetical protein